MTHAPALNLTTIFKVISPPLEMSNLKLHHAHPNMQAHAPFRVRKIYNLNCH